MRTHGWGGDPPTDDGEARRRILSVARARLEEAGTTRTAEVAQILGVTRQTVYRYFPSTSDLLTAASFDAIAELSVQLVSHVRGELANASDAADAVVEGLAFVYEHLRDDPALQRLLAPGELGRTLTGITAPTSISLGGTLLEEFGVDWESLGLDEAGRRELVEHLLRTLQSLILDPGSPPRTGTELRRYLGRWLAPALREGVVADLGAGSAARPATA